MPCVLMEDAQGGHLLGDFWFLEVNDSVMLNKSES